LVPFQVPSVARAPVLPKAVTSPIATTEEAARSEARNANGARTLAREGVAERVDVAEIRREARRVVVMMLLL
jgi:hypothetical protein